MTVAKLPAGKFPPLMVEPYVKELHDHVDSDTHEHQSGCVGEDGFHGRHGEGIFIWMIEKPGLADQDKNNRGGNAEENRFSRFFFSI